MPWLRIKRFLLGEPLASYDTRVVSLPKWKALGTLTADALSSVAYATDAILFLLLAAQALVWSIPVALLITVLLVIIMASYRQTISAYPTGGGAYIVAKDNLGETAGLVAAASLLIDYVLTVAVSVAASVENIASVFPALQTFRVAIAVVLVLLLTFVHLRGIRESSSVLALPTYLFVGSIFFLILSGFARLMLDEVVNAPPLLTTQYPAVSAVLVLRAFASGCVALTGVESISNGISLFQDPAPRNAKRTLIWLAVTLGAMFIGITSLSYVYRAVPHEGATLLAVLGREIFDGGFGYYLVQGAAALVLLLAARTGYSSFPRLASMLARDRYLPRQLASMGDRLVFSNGVLGLGISAAVLLMIFHARTIEILPLYALGVFVSFTLSQAGMIIYHRKDKRPGWLSSTMLNGLGAVTTLVVFLDIAYTKFFSGAWIIILGIPLMVLLFKRIHAHYLDVGRELSLTGRTPPARLKPIRHTVVIPVSGIHQGVLEAVQYALSISNDVRACYIELDPEATSRMEEAWKQWLPDVLFVVLKSPYRSVVEPLIRYIDDVEQTCHEDIVTVVIPEFVTTKWWHRLLHNHTAIFIRAALNLRRRKVVTSVRYHLRGG